MVGPRPGVGRGREMEVAFQKNSRRLWGAGGGPVKSATYAHWHSRGIPGMLLKKDPSTYMDRLGSGDWRSWRAGAEGSRCVSPTSTGPRGGARPCLPLLYSAPTQHKACCREGPGSTNVVLESNCPKAGTPLVLLLPTVSPP